MNDPSDRDERGVGGGVQRGVDSSFVYVQTEGLKKERTSILRKKKKKKKKRTKGQETATKNKQKRRSLSLFSDVCMLHGCVALYSAQTPHR